MIFNMEDHILSLGPSNYVKYDSTETLVTELTDGDFEDLRPSSVMTQCDNKNNLGYRLRRRREVLTQRKVIVDISFVLGVLGIVLVIIDTELILSGKIETDAPISTVLRVLTTLTTVCLLLTIVAYHATGIRLYMASAGLDDWRLATTTTKWMKLTTELLICFIHPLPFLNVFIPTISVSQASTGSSILTARIIPINAILTILMFLRLYLFGRFVVVHSNLFLDTSVQSLGALSRVKINAQFVFRALMSTTPGIVLTTVMLSTFLINSWNIRLCEVYTDPNSELGEFTQAMWLTAVTFLTVGYGDLIPRSYCGRLIAGSTGLMGVGIMALSVAVLAKKLEQSRSEKYIHTFVQQVALDKTRKHAAANVVKQAMLIWKLKKNGPCRSSTLLKHRSKLLTAKRIMQEAKFTKSHLSECMVGPVELSTGINDMCGIVTTVKDDQKLLEQRIANLETLVVNMSCQLHDVREMLRKMK